MSGSGNGIPVPTWKPSVYLITCVPTGKRYVGISKVDPVKRFRKHCTVAIRGESQLFLHRAIRKYGVDRFNLSVICEAESWNDAKELEKRYIAEYNTLNPIGFNMTAGGEGIVAYRHTDAAKAAMSRKHTGKVISDATRKKLSAILKGMKRTIETRIRMGNASKGRKVSEQTRQKLSHSLRIALSDPEVKEKMRASNRRRKGMPHSPEMKIKFAELNKSRLWTDEARAKVAASNRARKCSDATRKKMSVSCKAAMVANLDLRAKIATANSTRVWTPEMRMNMSIAVAEAKRRRCATARTTSVSVEMNAP